MNSRDIFRTNRDAYLNSFFAACPVACSAPGVVFWIGDHVNLRGGLSVCQTLPLRVYVGLEPLQLGEKRVEFGNHYVYQSIQDHGFAFVSEAEQGVWDATRSLEILGFISRKFPKLSAKIHILSEFSPWMGAAWNGAFSAALAGSLLVMHGVLSVEHVGAWTTARGWDLRDNAWFSECHRLAWHFSTICNGGRSSGGLVYCGLAGSKYPICYATERRFENSDPPIDVMQYRGQKFAWQSSETWLDGNIYYSGFRLEDLSPIKEPPIVFGVVSSDVERDTAMSIRQALVVKETLEETRTDIGNVRQVLAQQLGTNIDKLEFSTISNQPSAESLLGAYYWSLSITSAEIFSAVRAIFKDGSLSSLPRLAKVMLRAHGGLLGLDQGWPLGAAILAEGLRAAHEEGCGDKVGLKMTAAGGGGLLFFVGPQETNFMKKFRDSLSFLARTWAKPNLDIIWDSARGGLEPQGLRIENDLSGNPQGGYFNNDRFQEDIQCKTKQVFRWYRGQYSEQHLYAADVAYAQNCNDGVYCAFDDRPSKLVIKSEPIKAKKYPGITIEPTIAILETLVTNPKRISWEDLSDAVNARCEADYLPAVIKTYTRMLEEIFRDKALDLRIFSDKTFVELDPKGRSEIFVVDRTG